MTKTCLLLCALAAGCAHEIDPGVRATTPAPPSVANADFGSETFTGAGGVSLYGRWWKPRGAVRGVLVVQHGLNDHGDRYAHLAETLVARGYAVYAMDLRGHGRSAGPRVEVERFRDYLDDEAAWISRIRDKEPGTPIFVFGHSMGGLIMTIYAEEHPEVSGVILSAPALGLDAPSLQVAGIRLVAGLGSPGHMLPQRDADFTRDASVVADMGRDPLLTHHDGPTHTAVELVGAIEVAWANADHLTAPLIILHGSADKLTSPAATRDFVARAASPDKRHVVVDGSWHDIAHDPARDVFEGDIVAWLDAHTGGAAFPEQPAEPAHLRGDKASSAVGVEMGALFAHDTSALVATQLSFGSLWHGELAARIRDGVGVEALPIGVAVRPWRAGQIAIAGGVRAGWPGSWSDISVPIRLTIDSPIGGAHAIASVTANLNASGASEAARALEDEHSSLEAMLAVRFGGDHDYWSRVSAGSGPFVALMWSRTGTIDLWGISLGIHLWGVN